MSVWPTTTPQRVLRALIRLGWRVERISGSHHLLVRGPGERVTLAMHRKEWGPPILAKIAKDTGLRPEDL